MLVLSTTSLLQLQLLNRGPEGPLCWVLVFSTAFISNWLNCALSYIIVRCLPSSCGRHKSHSFNSNWLNFLCTELYNSSMPTFFLWVSQIALIQPVHGQGYILIFLDRMHSGAFPILTARLGWRSIYNNWYHYYLCIFISLLSNYYLVSDFINQFYKQKVCLRGVMVKAMDCWIVQFTQPLRSGRIWHKINFLSGV